MKYALFVTGLLTAALFFSFAVSSGGSLYQSLQSVGWQTGNLLLPGMALLGVALCRQISIEPDIEPKEEF